MTLFLAPSCVSNLKLGVVRIQNDVFIYRFLNDFKSYRNDKLCAHLLLILFMTVILRDKSIIHAIRWNKPIAYLNCYMESIYVCCPFHCFDNYLKEQFKRRKFSFYSLLQRFILYLPCSSALRL